MTILRYFWLLYLSQSPYVSKRLIPQILSVNIAKTDNAFNIELAAPGLQKENFKIAVEMEHLNIIVERNKNQWMEKIPGSIIKRSLITILLPAHSNIRKPQIITTYKPNARMEFCSLGAFFI